MILDERYKINSRNLRANMTDAEKLLWSKIREEQLGTKFRRQYVFENKYIVDFVCFSKKIIIDLDGGQHALSEEDKLRDAYFVSMGFKVLRFWNNEVLSDCNSCLEVIYDLIKNG